jgi:hypothetical protein
MQAEMAEQPAVLASLLQRRSDGLLEEVRATGATVIETARDPLVVPAALGPDAGCHGAAILAREELL